MSFAVVRDDFSQALRRYPALLYFGWDDIRQQYRRTFLGPIWLTFGTFAWIFGMAFVMAALFNQPVGDILPHAAVGMFVWTFLALGLTDGCQVFVAAAPLINSMRLPLFFHVLRALLRYVLLYMHYLLVCILLMIILGHAPGFMALLAIPGILLQILLVFGCILMMGFTNARYRDLMPIVGVMCQLMPLMTPIAWKRDMLQKHVWLADLNPFYHLIEIVRAPLMGEMPRLLSYEVSIGVTLLVLIIGFWRYHAVRYKLIFWV